MAKKQARNTAPKAPAPPPEFVTYTHRTINRAAWNSFRERAKHEGHTAVWLLDRFIEKYGNGEKVF